MAMEAVQVGRSGLRVSPLCLGTMLFGTYLDEAASATMLDEAAGLGISFLDLADRYPVPPRAGHFGRTEEIVGRWLRDHRQEFVLATKFGGRVGAGANDAGGSRKHVIEACEASLRRLGIDHIDLYWMHMPDPGTPIEETMEAVGQLQAAGKILYFGFSNVNATQLSVALSESVGLRGAPRPVAIQPRYNLLAREPEEQLLPLAVATGLGVVPYNPLAGGMLGGQYRQGEPLPAGSRFADEYFEIDRGHYLLDRAFPVVDGLAGIAKREGLTPAQAAVAWLLTRPGVSSVILGASRPRQLTQIVAGVRRGLSLGALQQLDKLSIPSG